MYILGISAFYHDSAACLIKDGKNDFTKRGLEEMANNMAINIKPIVENLMKNSNNNNFS